MSAGEAETLSGRTLASEGGFRACRDQTGTRGTLINFNVNQYIGDLSMSHRMTPELLRLKVPEAVKPEHVVIGTIRRYVNEGKMFTSVDIANDVKRLGLWVRNRSVSQFLQKEALQIADDQGKEYKSELINVQAEGTTVQAYVYFPADKEASAYGDTAQKAITPDDCRKMFTNREDKIDDFQDEPEESESGRSDFQQITGVVSDVLDIFNALGSGSRSR